MRFFQSYGAHLAGCIGGSMLSAALMIYGLLSVKAPGKTWVGFGLCVCFLIGTAWRIVREKNAEIKKLSDSRLSERREFQEVIKSKEASIESSGNLLALAERSAEETEARLGTECTRLTEEVATIRRGVERAGPDLVIGFADTTIGRVFCIKNCSHDKDAYRVKLATVEGRSWSMEVDIIDRVPAQVTQQLRATLTRKEDGASSSDDFSEFFFDACGCGSVSLEFSLTFSDAWGSEFGRSAVVETDLAKETFHTARIVSHGPIRLMRPFYESLLQEQQFRVPTTDAR